MGVPAVSRSFDRWLSSDGFGISLHRETSGDKRERFASTESISPPPLRAAPWGHASKTRFGFSREQGETIKGATLGDSAFYL